MFSNSRINHSNAHWTELALLWLWRWRKVDPGPNTSKCGICIQRAAADATPGWNTVGLLLLLFFFKANRKVAQLFLQSLKKFDENTESDRLIRHLHSTAPRGSEGTTDSRVERQWLRWQLDLFIYQSVVSQDYCTRLFSSSCTWASSTSLYSLWKWLNEALQLGHRVYTLESHPKIRQQGRLVARHHSSPKNVERSKISGNKWWPLDSVRWSWRCMGKVQMDRWLWLVISWEIDSQVLLWI